MSAEGIDVVDTLRDLLIHLANNRETKGIYRLKIENAQKAVLLVKELLESSSSICNYQHPNPTEWDALHSAVRRCKGK